MVCPPRDYDPANIMFPWSGAHPTLPNRSVSTAVAMAFGSLAQAKDRVAAGANADVHCLVPATSGVVFRARSENVTPEAARSKQRTPPVAPAATLNFTGAGQARA